MTRVVDPKPVGPLVAGGTDRDPAPLVVVPEILQFDK